jgi:RNA polymerase sigma factor (sigma-70 family)
MTLMLNQLPSVAVNRSAASGMIADPDSLAIPPTDGERLMRFRRYRDESAFTEIVDAHAKMVWGVCSQILRHQQDVEDAFQATFLILARKAGSIRAADSAAGWLYRVAFRTSLLARDRRRRRSEMSLVDDPRSLDDQFAAIEQNEQCLVLLEELNALPQKYRQPLVLCYMEGRTRREAADLLGVTAQTVKGLLARGTRMLRSRLVRRGAALSSSMALLVTAVEASQASAAPALAASTAALGASFALKTKLAFSGSKGAALKGAAAAALAEKGIIAMTVASVSKPVAGLLGVVLTVGALAVADAEPARKVIITDDAGTLTLTSTAGEVSEDEGEASVTIDGSGPNEAGDQRPGGAPSGEAGATSASEKIDPQAPISGMSNVDVITTAAPLTVPRATETRSAVINDVLMTSPVPLPSRVVQPVSTTFELTRDPQFLYSSSGQVSMHAPMGNARGGESEAALKLEGEYWALKAEGLKKKAQAIEAKVVNANAQFQLGTGPMTEGDILDVAAEKDLTLAEVKLCEVNAQRVRDSLEAQNKAAAETERLKTDVKRVMKAAAEAERAALESQRDALDQARKGVEASKEQAEGAGTLVANGLAVRAKAPAIVIEKRAKIDKVPAPAQEARLKEVAALSSDLSGVTVISTEELQRLRKIAETAEKLQAEMKLLQANPKEADGEMQKH